MYCSRVKPVGYGIRYKRKIRLDDILKQQPAIDHMLMIYGWLFILQLMMAYYTSSSRPSTKL